MSWAIVASVGGAVVGGVISSNGSKSAANTQAASADRANQVNLDIFNKQTELQEPFRQNGLAAQNRLSFLLGLSGTGTGTGTAAPAASGATGQVNPNLNFGGTESADAIRARLAPQFTDPKFGGNGVDDAGLQAAIQAETQRQQQDVVRRQLAPQFTDPKFGGNGVDDAGLNSAVQTAMQAEAQRQQTATNGNGLEGFGSLSQQFGQGDYQNDGAPKIDPFTQTPNLPTFDQQAPEVAQFGQRAPAQQIGQYQGPEALAGFQSRPELAQYNGPQDLASFQSRPDLSGFEDMPAFNADAMRDDPGYQFRLDEGQKGIERTAAARGGVLSGAAVKAAERFGQDYASNEYGNSFNRYQTTRGNKLQTYLTNQNTDQTNRANAVQDFGLNQNTAQLNNTNKLQTYLTNQNTQQANRTNAVQDYTTNRDTSQLNTANNLQTYTTNRATQQQNTDNQVRDFNDNLGVQQANYANQRSAYDTNFNQFQVNRTNATNDWKDQLSAYSMNRANSMQDYQAAYDRFQQDRGNVINPLLSLMGAGQQATNQQSAAAQNFGAQSSSAIQAAGNARAAGQVGAANAVTSAIGQGTSMYNNNMLMNRLFPPGGTTGSAVNMGSATGSDLSMFYQ
jgi:hypothetical protein